MALGVESMTLDDFALPMARRPALTNALWLRSRARVGFCREREREVNARDIFSSARFGDRCCCCCSRDTHTRKSTDVHKSVEERERERKLWGRSASVKFALGRQISLLPVSLFLSLVVSFRVVSLVSLVSGAKTPRSPTLPGGLRVLYRNHFLFCTGQPRGARQFTHPLS